MKEHLKKFFLFSAGTYIGAIIGLFTIPLTTRLITPEENGIFTFFVLIINLSIIVVSLGLDQGFIRFFHETEEQGRGKLLRMCLKYPLVLMLLLSVFILIFYKIISHYTFGEVSFNLTIILVLTIVVTLLHRYAQYVLRMQQKAALFSFFQVILQILNIVAILLFYQIYGNDYRTVIYALCISTAITLVGMVISERSLWFSQSNIPNVTQKELFAYSKPFILTFILLYLFQGIDTIALKTFSTSYEVGIFGTAMRVIAIFSIIQTGFAQYFVPVSFEHYEKHPKDHNFFIIINTIITCVMFLFGTFVLMFRTAFILLLGSAYTKAVAILPFLIFVPMMYTISETTVIGISFTKKTQYHQYIAFVVAVLNVGLNLMLVPRFGSLAASFATGTSYIFFFLLRTYFSNRLLPMGFQLGRTYVLIFIFFIYAAIATLIQKWYIDLGFGFFVSGIIILIYYKDIKKGYVLLRTSFLKKEYNTGEYVEEQLLEESIIESEKI